MFLVIRSSINRCQVNQITSGKCAKTKYILYVCAICVCCLWICCGGRPFSTRTRTICLKPSNCFDIITIRPYGLTNVQSRVLYYHSTLRVDLDKHYMADDNCFYVFIYNRTAGAYSIEIINSGFTIINCVNF